jgi:endoribonuclease Dicer
MSDSDGFITKENCVYLLNRYCVRLPSDAMTNLTPRFQVEKKSEPTNSVHFKCRLYLPINSGVREPIESEWFDSVNDAKLDACYKTCIVLYGKNFFISLF